VLRRDTSGGSGRSSGDPPAELRDSSSPDDVVSLLLSSAPLASVPTYGSSAVAGAGAPLPPNSSRVNRLVRSGCRNLFSPPPTHPRAALLRRCEKKKAMESPSTATVSSGSTMAGTSLDAFLDPCESPAGGVSSPEEPVLGSTRAGYVGWSGPVGGGGTASVGKKGGAGAAEEADGEGCACPG
jgi:hypothetical protein